ncbi:hypothetical protein [Bacteroides sp.]
MDIIDRLQEIIDYAGLNVSSFAKKIGVVDQTIRGIVVQRRNKPGFDILSKILQTFTWLDAEWLITGKGEMIKEESSVKTENNPSLTELIQYLREKDLKIEKLIEEKTELKIKFEMAKKTGVQKEEQTHTSFTPKGKIPREF